VCYMPCPSHPSWLHNSNIFGEENKLWSAVLCSFIRPPIISPILGPNIHLSTLFSNTLNVRDQVLHHEFLMHN
jgi:hypothetical protein